MCPHMQIELVIPIGGLVFFDGVETPDPIFALIAFVHVWGYNAWKVFGIVGIHRECEVLQPVAPGGETPSGGVGGKIVRFFPGFQTFAIPLSASVTEIVAANGKNALVVAVFLQQFFTVGEEIGTGYRVLEEDDAFVLVREKPTDGSVDHPGLAMMCILPEGVQLTGPFRSHDTSGLVCPLCVKRIVRKRTVASYVQLHGLYGSQCLEDFVCLFNAVVQNQQYRDFEHDGVNFGKATWTLQSKPP